MRTHNPGMAKKTGPDLTYSWQGGEPRDRWDGTTSNKNMNGCIYSYVVLSSPKNSNVNRFV